MAAKSSQDPGPVEKAKVREHANVVTPSNPAEGSLYTPLIVGVTLRASEQVGKLVAVASIEESEKQVAIMTGERRLLQTKDNARKQYLDPYRHDPARTNRRLNLIADAMVEMYGPEKGAQYRFVANVLRKSRQLGEVSNSW